MAIYGIIIAIIFASKMSDSGKPATDSDYFSGFALFFSGVTVGVVNLFCGYRNFLLLPSFLMLTACLAL